MSYYILPKNLNNMIIEIDFDDTNHDTNDDTNDDKKFINIDKLTDKNNIFISKTLYYFLYNIKKQIKYLNNLNINDDSYHTYDELITIINPYNFVFNYIPEINLSISKLINSENLFYDLIEISNVLNIFDMFINKNINILNIGNNFKDSLNCIKVFRKKYIYDNFLNYNEINFNIYKYIYDIKLDFIFIELEKSSSNNLNNYIINLIKIILILLKYQNKNGISILKIDKTFYKPVLDILYLLTSLYENVYIVKPNTSNIITTEKYIVCKNFILTNEKIDLYNKNYNILFSFLINFQKNNSQYKNKIIKNIIQNKIPIYFMNKIDEINIIIGQQQIIYLNKIINLLKKKKNNEKLEIIIKTNIQKSIYWCKKNKIPYNTLFDHILNDNVFYEHQNNQCIFNNNIFENNNCFFV